MTAAVTGTTTVGSACQKWKNPTWPICTQKATQTKKPYKCLQENAHTQLDVPTVLVRTASDPSFLLFRLVSTFSAQSESKSQTQTILVLSSSSVGVSEFRTYSPVTPVGHWLCVRLGHTAREPSQRRVESKE